MFFCPELLKKRGHPFFFIWIAATHEGPRLKKYLPPRKIRCIDLPHVASEILKMTVTHYPPSIPRSPSDKIPYFSLYLSSQLMHGSCILLRKQAAILVEDCYNISKSMKKIKWSEEKKDLVVQIIREQKSHSKEPFVDEYVEEGLSLAATKPMMFPHTVAESTITMEELTFSKEVIRESDLKFGDEGGISILDISLEDALSPELDKMGRVFSDIEQLQNQEISEGVLGEGSRVISAPVEDFTEMNQPFTLFSEALMDEAVELNQIELPHELPLIENVSQQPQAVDHVEGQSIQEVGLLVETSHGELGNETQPLNHAREELDVIDLSAVVETRGKRRRKHNQRFKDNVIEIPSAVMRENIQGFASNASVYEDFVRMRLQSTWFRKDFLTDIGMRRNLNLGLVPLIHRAFITHPVPNQERDASFHEMSRKTSCESREAETVSERVLAPNSFQQGEGDMPAFVETSMQALPEADGPALVEAEQLFLSSPTSKRPRIEELEVEAIVSKKQGPEVSVSDQEEKTVKSMKRILDPRETDSKRRKTSPMLEMDFCNPTSIPPQTEIPENLPEMMQEDFSQLYCADLQPISIRDEIPSLLPESSASEVETSQDKVLEKILLKANENNAHSISVLDVCPPKITKRKHAADFFNALLSLHKDNKIIIRQEIDDETIQPACLSVVQND